MSEVIHYFKKVGFEELKTLEDFGALYSKCTGLSDKGKVKSIYTETYSESNETRVYKSEVVAREPISCTMTLFFIGEERRQNYDVFVNTISDGLWYYWDTERKMKIKFFLQDQIAIKDDNYKGKIKYLEVDLKMQCVWGESKPCDEDGNPWDEDGNLT
jgi:hypothetical protein